MGTINHVSSAGGAPHHFVYRKRKPIVVLRQVGALLYTSGHGPEDQITGKPVFQGRIGAELTPQQGYLAARECGVILLNALREHLGTLDRLKGLVKATALVNCAEGFDGLDSVMDGFSDLMAEVLEERGYHARTVMGTRNLPNGNIPIEIELIAEVESPAQSGR